MSQKRVNSQLNIQIDAFKSFQINIYEIKNLNSQTKFTDFINFIQLKNEYLLPRWKKYWLTTYLVHVKF